MLPPKNFSIKEAINKAGGYNTGCIYELGKAYFWGWDTDKDFIKASELWRGAGAWHEEIGGINSENDLKISELEAYRGDPRSMLFLGEIYYHGLGVKENMTVALDWWSRSAHKGESDGMYRLGWYFWHHNNLKLARKWLNKAAKQKHSAAIADLKKM
ncbi:hypothetical protein GCM10027035_18520 [Emticicia sediminis]